MMMLLISCAPKNPDLCHVLQLYEMHDDDFLTEKSANILADNKATILRECYGQNNL